jgi:uncharacterized protein YdhG (YjbR/CyaY superfamily)
MRSEAATTAEYFANLPEDRKAAMTKLHTIIKSNLPKGFKEAMGYGMPGWVVPHTLFPAGYHCDPSQPLPFIGMASQKNYIALYHMGLYSDQSLLEWFKAEWAKASKKKLDMGKSCIRFKKAEDIPYELIGELASKITPQEWIEHYQSVFRASRTRQKQGQS